MRRVQARSDRGHARWRGPGVPGGPALLAMLVAIAGACSVLQPNPECRIDDRCVAAVAAARSVAPLDGARVVVLAGRSLRGLFHAEVHVCHADGRNVLVDVMGDDLKAAVRDTPWDDPPCR